MSVKCLSVCSENHLDYIGNLNNNITETDEFVFQRKVKSLSKGTDMLLQNGVIVKSEDEEGGSHLRLSLFGNQKTHTE